MRDYRKWKRGNPRVANLLLDSANPRIPKGRGVHEQRDLIAELVEHDHVYELAKAISSEGYYPLEYLIAIEDDGKTVVIEGNRRLAALKLLINPELAPEGSEKRFRTLSANVPLDAIDKVPTVYAPSRELAAPLIMQKHTRTQVERWSVLMQASFYKSLAETGIKLGDLAEQYGRPPSEIAGFLRTDTMYAIACSLEYPDEVAERVRDPRQFPAAVLQRVLDIPKAREFIGIEFRDQVKLNGKVDVKDFKRVYGKIITDIAMEDVDTRKLNKVEDVERYLAEISQYKPKKGSKGKFSAESFGIEVPDLAKGGGANSPTARPSKKRKSETMIPPGIRCELKNQRIVDIFDELRKLHRVKFPNSCAVLLRMLLELSVGEYLEATNQIKPLLEAAKKKKKGPDWYPTLRQLLGAILKDSHVTGRMKTLAKKKLNRLVSQESSLLSLDDLDGYVHNPYMHPTDRELLALWEALEGLFEITLKAPTVPK